MSTENERKQILAMIESGKLTPSQGVKLLQALDDTFESDQPVGDEQVISVDTAAVQAAVPPENPIPQATPQPSVVPVETPSASGEATNDDNAAMAEAAAPVETRLPLSPQMRPILKPGGAG
jgi:hypothetical protein